MKRGAILLAAFLVAPTFALAGGIGQEMSQCVKDLGGQAAPLCVKAAKDGSLASGCSYINDGCCNNNFEEVDPDCSSGSVPNGEDCFFNSQCISGLCDVAAEALVGSCIGLPENALCTSPEQCATGLSCSAGVCTVPRARYVYIDIPMQWEEAKNFCSSRGEHLVTITSSSENDYVLGMLPSSIGNIWIGGYQTSSNNEPGGEWTWISGEDFYAYTNWGVVPQLGWIEPDNNLGGQQCLVMWGPAMSQYGAQGMFDDLQCAWGNGWTFVCEYE